MEQAVYLLMRICCIVMLRGIFDKGIGKVGLGQQVRHKLVNGFVAVK